MAVLLLLPHPSSPGVALCRPAFVEHVPPIAFISGGWQARDKYAFPSDDETSVPLPPRQHGYRTVAFSWDELRRIVVETGDLAWLSRSITQEETYQRYMIDLRREYRSVHDFVMHSKFGFAKRFNETTQRWETTTESPKEVLSVLLPNDFPYYTEDGIEHWVLWKLNGKLVDEDVEKARADLEEKLGDVIDFIHWENPPNLKSLPDIAHIHILVRRDANAGDGGK